MKTRLMALAAILTMCVCGQFVFPPSGGIGVGAVNAKATCAGPATSCAVDVTSLNLASFDTALAQCWTASAPVTITGYSTTGSNPLTGVTLTYASTSGVTCRVNSNGGSGPTGPTGPANGWTDNGSTVTVNSGRTVAMGTALPANIGGQRWYFAAGKNGAVCDGTTDDTAALTALLGTVNTAGGGTIEVVGTCRIDGQITLPNATNTPGASGLVPSQSAIRITGGGFTANGNWKDLPRSPSVLDLRYNSPTGKIDTRGLGLLEIDHLTLKDSGSDCAAFIYTTNTTPVIHHNTFIGTHTGLQACNDVIVLGGTTIAVDGTASAAFWGFGTASIDHNEFHYIRRGAYFRQYANAIQFIGNSFSLSCGSDQTTAVTAATNASPAVLTVAGHGFTYSDSGKFKLTFTGATGNWAALNGNAYLVTVVDADTLSIPVDSSTFGALTGSLAFYSGAAIEFWNAQGNVIQNNLVELTHYPYFAKLTGSLRNAFTNNTLWDCPDIVTGLVWADSVSVTTTSGNPPFIHGSTCLSLPMLGVGGNLLGTLGGTTNFLNALKLNTNTITTSQLVGDGTRDAWSHVRILNTQASRPFAIEDQTGTQKVWIDRDFGFNSVGSMTVNSFSTAGNAILGPGGASYGRLAFYPSSSSTTSGELDFDKANSSTMGHVYGSGTTFHVGSRTGIDLMLDSGSGVLWNIGGTWMAKMYASGGLYLGQSQADPGANNLTVQGTVKAGGGSANKAVCWKTDGKTLGYCSTQPDSTGACTCN